MTLEELGAALRAERERRRLNLEDVASRLKIPVRMLRALEDGDTASLPHLAYAKGFIRSYALFLGMVAEEVSEAADVIGDNIVPAKPVEIPLPAPAKSGSVNPIRVILAILALVLFGVAGLSAWQPELAERVMTMVRDKASEIPVPRVMPAEEIASLGASQNKACVDNSANRPVTGKQEMTDSERITSPGSVKAGGSSTQTPDHVISGDAARKNASRADPDVASGSSSAGQKPGGQPVAMRSSGTDGKSQSVMEKTARHGGPVSGDDHQTGLHKLILTATEACSVQSRADGTQNRQFAMRRGDTFALMFVKSLEVRIGNVKAVRLRYDGREVDLSDGPLARTLQFPLVEGQ